jgi:hypothetical protein
MPRRQILALGGAILALIAIPSAAALAAGSAHAAAGTTTVTVRVEGAKSTLLAPTTTKTHTGSITKGGTPTGKCPATSAAGALDVATHHNWDASYSVKYSSLFITSILGESFASKSAKYYWAIYVNNRYASSGACGITLHRGDQLLFAAAPITGTVYPTSITAPPTATVGHPFKVKVVWYTAKGIAKPLAGAKVSSATATIGTTNARGVLTVVANHAGTLVLRATRSGYIRTAPARVHVT